MRTVIRPQGFPILYADIVKRTDMHAFSARNTIISSIEFLCMNDERIEQAVNDSAVQFISERNICLREEISIQNIKCRAVYYDFCPLYNLQRLFRSRC